MNREYAVVFDFDGTLADSRNAMLLATNFMLIDESRRTLTMPEILPLLGGGARQLVDFAFRLTGKPLTNPDDMVGRWRDIHDAIAAQYTTLYPDVVPTLNALRDRRVAVGICTGKPRQPTLNLLESLGIREHFTSVFGQDSTPTPKPHPGHLLAVLDELGANCESALMVGDAEADISVARAAGVASLLVARDTVGPDGATWSVTRLDELLPIVDEKLRGGGASHRGACPSER